MSRRLDRRGFTLAEAVLAAAVTGIIAVSFAAFLTHVMKTATKDVNQTQAQEQARLALAKIEENLLHANEIQVASATFVQYIVDIDQSPGYDRNGDLNGDGIPNYRDPDRDSDASSLLPAASQWKAGFNLKDDDEDGDGNIDVREQLYLKNGSLWFDMSVNEAPWGGQYLKKIGVRVSTLTFSYYGNKANSLGSDVDSDGDGVVTAAEIDAGAGNGNGALDTAFEMSYLTTVRVDIGIDYNSDGKTDYQTQTDVFPPLLPLKSQTY